MHLILTLLLKKITAVHWSRDSNDYLEQPANKIAERLIENPIKLGDITLLHDDECCIDALDILIPQCLEQGYSFKALENKY
ncbi:hypothetical protein [Colwellia sp. PAMC 21821]|uniref:hypothetical protein n=1 Tax=Colwellia sp. PAMC 21821 TaxID=1816219 RepID=UPI0009C14043|nr:hypothetical protein [Colwellia sp. PAMC 21821]ARD44545.1 hypothetical protein A3Q33_09625 [Colwellia sp. PAMC 21821]